MKIGLAADHKGYVLKQMLYTTLLSSGFKVTDFGAFHLDERDDCDDFIIPLAQALQRKELERGIALIGNGTGAAIIANKIKCVRAAVIQDHFHAHREVEENDINLICIQPTNTNFLTAKEMIELFLEAKFEREERNTRRLWKLMALERIR